MASSARFASSLLFLTLLLVVSLGCCSAAVSPRLQQLLLAHERGQSLAELPPPPPPSPTSTSSLSSALASLDCPLTSDWTSNFTGTLAISNFVGVAPCTLLVLYFNRTSVLQLAALDVRDGTELWSIVVGSGWINAGEGLAVQYTSSSTTPTRAYVPVLNITGLFEWTELIMAVSWESGFPRILWTTALGQDEHVWSSVPSVGGDADGVLLGFSTQGQDWVSIDGANGRVLSSAQTASTNGLFLTAERPARMLKADGGNATAFELQKDGSWQRTGSSAYNQSQWRMIPDVNAPYLHFTGRLPQQPNVLVLQSNDPSMRDQWRAVDVDTGAQVWKVDGYDIFTGAWVRLNGFTAREAQVAVHPLNASRALVTGRAFNSSYALVVQVALMDLTTGQLLATSPVSPVFFAPESYNSYFQWYSASGAVATFMDLRGTATPSLYLAYDSSTLQSVSWGLLPAGNPLHEVLSVFAAVRKEGAALLWRDGDQMQARNAPAWTSAKRESEEDSSVRMS